jgi:hypothetical protein
MVEVRTMNEFDELHALDLLAHPGRWRYRGVGTSTMIAYVAGKHMSHVHAENDKFKRVRIIWMIPVLEWQRHLLPLATQVLIATGIPGASVREQGGRRVIETAWGEIAFLRPRDIPERIVGFYGVKIVGMAEFGKWGELEEADYDALDYLRQINKLGAI